MARTRFVVVAALLVMAAPLPAQRSMPTITVARTPAVPTRALVAAFAKRDLQALVALHSADARVLTPNGQLVGPSAGLDRFYAAFLQNGGTLAPGQVTYRAGTVVLEGHFDVAGQGAGEPAARGTFLLLWTQDPATEEWRVTNAAWTLRQ